MNINVLELKAILFGLASLVKERNLAVRIWTDNATAVSYVNKKGGVKSPLCLEVAHKIWNLAESNNLRLRAAHIPGVQNTLADMYSRHFKENTEWELSPKLYDEIVKRWGTPTIDLFASRLNNKCLSYVSWQPDPSAAFIDAFSLNWDFEFGYLFPPFALISRVWRKLVAEGTNAILVTPAWPGQPWYTEVRTRAKDCLLFPKRTGNLLHPAPEIRKDQMHKIPLAVFRF